MFNFRLNRWYLFLLYILYMYRGITMCKFKRQFSDLLTRNFPFVAGILFRRAILRDAQISRYLCAAAELKFSIIYSRAREDFTWILRLLRYYVCESFDFPMALEIALSHLYISKGRKFAYFNFFFIAKNFKIIAHILFSR